MKTDCLLPINLDEAKRRGWDELDIILVSGDAYVDHPSFGAAVIGRVLEDRGYRVGIIAQPDWRSTKDFLKLGKPRLFFGVTSGNVDSMLCHYTANKKLRRDDSYSPGNKYGLRPNRAVIVYTNRLREVFGCTPVVLGGVEASLRRFAHYDYWEDTVRRSILPDSKADMLVYGMGEKQIIEIADRLKSGQKPDEIDNIHGTVVIKKNIVNINDSVLLPSFEVIKQDKNEFNKAAKIILEEQDPFLGHSLIQPHADRFIVQLPPAKPLVPKELDKIYELSYTRKWHSVYDSLGGVPALKIVQFSVTSHRGCFGECSFCSLMCHMGRIVQSRTPDSILREIESFTRHKDFKGIVMDVGGPTANMYLSSCEKWQGVGACKNKSCLAPSKCSNLKLGYAETLKLWKKALRIPKVKRVFVCTGVRHDLLVDSESDEYLEELCRNHVSGQLKVAPEHVDNTVLGIMNKSTFETYEKFCKRYSEVNRKLGKKQYLVQYFISSHPGSTLESMYKLAQYVKKLGYLPEQVQDFIPMPMTRATAMYYTGKDPLTGRAVYCARDQKEKMMQKALIHFMDRKNRKLVEEALKRLKKSL